MLKINKVQEIQIEKWLPGPVNQAIHCDPCTGDIKISAKSLDMTLRHDLAITIITFAGDKQSHYKHEYERYPVFMVLCYMFDQFDHLLHLAKCHHHWLLHLYECTEIMEI